MERAVVGGTTRLRYTIDSSGKVDRVEVVQSAGDSEEHKKLDRLSVSYLSTCIFPANPGAVGGVHTIDFDYVLQ
jgi:TonB family protein